MMIGSFLGGIVAAAIGERRGIKKGRKAGYEAGFAAGLVQGSKDTPFHVERVSRDVWNEVMLVQSRSANRLSRVAVELNTMREQILADIEACAKRFDSTPGNDAQKAA